MVPWEARGPAAARRADLAEREDSVVPSGPIVVREVVPLHLAPQLGPRPTLTRQHRSGGRTG